MMSLERYGFLEFFHFPSVETSSLQGKKDDFVVHVHFFFTVKTRKLELDSSGVDSKKSFSILGHLGLGKCVDSLEKPAWTSPVVNLGIFDVVVEVSWGSY
jgi:hypothetical protein